MKDDIARREKEETDEVFGPDGKPYPRGRCDTCGAPCDDETGDCTAEPSHQMALL